MDVHSRISPSLLLLQQVEHDRIHVNVTFQMVRLNERAVRRSNPNQERMRVRVRVRVRAYMRK